MKRSTLFFITVLALLSALSSCTLHSGQQTFAPLNQESTDKLVPGLLPRYFTPFFARNVVELPDDDTGRFKTWLGEPIPQLDNQFGIGHVFGSGLSRGVGIRMRGVLHFPEAGSYRFQALANDGIRVFFGEALVVDDPGQHSDQLSPVGAVDIPAPGWYPVRVDYFQRKGTAALHLFWQPPGSATMSIVPASAYAHIPVE